MDNSPRIHISQIHLKTAENINSTPMPNDDYHIWILVGAQTLMRKSFVYRHLVYVTSYSSGATVWKDERSGHTVLVDGAAGTISAEERC